MQLRLVYASIALAIVALHGCARSPQTREARFLTRGKELMKRNQHSAAMLEFQNAIEIMPRDAEAYYQLALTYLGTRNPRPAIAALIKATELNPKHVDAQLKLSSLMAQSGSG